MDAVKVLIVLLYIGENVHSESYLSKAIAPDKAAYCVFMQFRERENAIKLISLRTKTQ